MKAQGGPKKEESKERGRREEKKEEKQAKLGPTGQDRWAKKARPVMTGRMHSLEQGQPCLTGHDRSASPVRPVVTGRPCKFQVPDSRQ